jgi:lipid-A-disaccharide synthase-like uncharacterized protein
MAFADSLVQFDINLVDFLSIIAACGLVLFFILAALTAPALAFATESLYAAKRKAFYDKCAMQISQAGFWAGILIFMVVGFSVAAGLAAYQPEMLDPPLVWQPLALFAPAFAAVSLMALYSVTWTALKNTRPAHLALGCVAALYGLALMLALFLLLSYAQQPMLPLLLWDAPLLAFDMLLDEFLGSTHQWLMFSFLLCAGTAAIASLSQLWFVIRRLKADYGRDYYAFAMRYAARAALAFTLAQAGLAGLIVYRLIKAVPREFRQPPDPGVGLVAFGLPLVCCLLWLLIAKSATPLRHKGGIFFSCLFLIISLCAQLLMIFNTFPMV